MPPRDGRETGPEVSICVPTYQGARYLRPCLESALAQTAESFEVVLVDDGSDDGTVDVARAAFAGDARCRLAINSQRAGLPGNWNRCLELARGEWIKFLFQDDRLEPDCLSIMVDAARTTGRGVVACGRRYEFESGVARDRRDWYRRHPSLEDLFPGKADVSPEEFNRLALARPGHNLLGEPTSILIHADLFLRYGEFNRDLMMICDTECWNRLVSHEGLAVVPGELATFRVHPDSASVERLEESYRLALDGLILLHEMAYAPEYEAMRRTAETMSPAVEPAELLGARAVEAHDWAFRGTSEGHSASESLQEAWLALTKSYPRIQQIAQVR